MKFPRHITYIVAIDEVGRGPIAGPVTLGAVMICRCDLSPVMKKIAGIRDSKKLSHQQRITWFDTLDRNHRVTSATASVGSAYIDRHGIVKALSTGVARVIKKLSLDPDTTFVMLDGSLYAPATYSFQETIIKGDDKEPLISAASIIAKVTRDAKMVRYANRYHHYGFEGNKGYGTESHYDAIKKYGPCRIHRLTWI